MTPDEILIRERRRLMRRLDAAMVAPLSSGGRNSRGLDALMALQLFDKLHPEIEELTHDRR